MAIPKTTEEQKTMAKIIAQNTPENPVADVWVNFRKKTVCNEFEPGCVGLIPGDHLKDDKKFAGFLPYSHHFVYLGSGVFAHANFHAAWSYVDDRFELASLETLLATRNHMQLINYPAGLGRLPRKKTVELAANMVGYYHYHLIWSNCEHIVYYVVTGMGKSPQVERVLRGAISSLVLLVLLNIFFIGGLIGGRTIRATT